MTLEEVLSISSSDEFIKNIAAIEKLLCRVPEGLEELQTKAIAEHDKLEHEVLSREDKTVGPEGKKKIIKTAKLVIPVQKKIVNTAVAFLFGTPVKLSLSDFEDSHEEAFKAFTKLWKKNKLDYHNKELARRVFVETRAAELFYIVINPITKEKRIRTMLLCKKNGDSIFPTYDQYGDMVAFTRKYISLNSEGKEVENMDVYTSQREISATKNGDTWEAVITPSLIGKIPIIYYEQDSPEWTDVQTLIDRQEMLMSKNADTNDYFGSPSVKVKGKLASGPDKDEIGKIFNLEGQQSGDKIEFGDVEYLTWDRTPEAIKLEYEVLKDIIYSSTSTPDLSFNNVKGTGNLSGIALKFMFLDAVLKSLNKQEIFGEGLDRRVNLIKSMMPLLDVGAGKAAQEMDVNIEFQDALPEDIKEVIEMLSTAVESGLMSGESAIKMNPIIKDSQVEVDKVKAERQEAVQLENQVNESFLNNE